MKVCFFGTGNIAHSHAQALQSVPGAQLAGVFDLNPVAAKKFAAQYKINQIYDSIEKVINDPLIDVIHVLTPPDSHFDLVNRITLAGKRVFVEKPIATTEAQFSALSLLPENQKTLVGINQNSCFHPSFERVLNIVRSGSLGKIRYIECTFEPFLKQLASAQFTHWMFSNPLNLLLEQAVHPLAQIVAVANATDTSKLVVLPGDLITVSKNASFVPSLTAAFEQGGIPVTFRMRVGASFPVWRLKVVCDDGYAVADMLSNNASIVRRSKFLEAGDNAIIQSGVALKWLSQSVGNFKDYCLSQAGLKQRNDSFFLGMKGSIHAFYKSIRNNEQFLANAAFGRSLVLLCADIAKQLPSTVHNVAPKSASPTGSLVTVFGATGFIGKHAVSHLLEKGYRVRAIARGTKNLGAPFDSPGVELVRGDVKNINDVRSAIEGSEFVVNLAHGGGGSTYEEIRASMVDSALSIASICDELNIKKLVHVGSIASLYLGDKNELITDVASPDPLRIKRGDYARAKAECDDLIEKSSASSKTQVINLRPGLVVGAGTSPLHSGIGFFNNEQHIIGWNEGKNPLPFVLVSDVASAIEKSLTAPKRGFAAYNLVGDFRPSAEQYVKMLSSDLARPFVFHSSSVNGLMTVEIGKWLIKKVAGKNAAFPSKRDLLSRGLKAKFDCSQAKNDLGWIPSASEEAFREQAIKVHNV
jgi:2-alkyl-3-oxoalkanoate reductase